MSKKADRKLAEAVKKRMEAELPKNLKVEFVDKKSGRLTVTSKDEDHEFDAVELLRAMVTQLNKERNIHEN